MLATNLCTNTDIVIDNVTVSKNKNANLLLSLSYSDTSSVSVTIENSRIEGGTELAWGGLIMLYDSSQLQLHNCPNPQNSDKNKKSMLRIFNTTVTRNIGAGLAILINSKYATFDVEIDQVILSENNATLGFETDTEFQNAGVLDGAGVLFDTLGALLILGNSSSEDCPRQSFSHENITIKISNSFVTRNTGGGVVISSFTNCTICKWNIEISQVTFIENINGITGLQWGGNLLVLMTGTRISTISNSYLRISNCVFQSGVAQAGGGACIAGIFIVDGFDEVMNKTNQWISIQHSHFIGNTGLWGGGLSILIFYLPSRNELFHLNALVSTVYVENTTFTDNAALSGSAVHVTHGKLNSLAAAGLLQTVFENTTFRHNHQNIDGLPFPRNANVPGTKTTAYFMYVQNVTISNCEFIQNNGTALTAEQSNIIFTGDVLFRENWSILGGALSLFYSFQFLLPQTYLLFANNHAERFGGAIYYLLHLENYMIMNKCLMTIYALPPNVSVEDSGVRIDFINNTAVEAGDAMYGTPFDAEVCTKVPSVGHLCCDQSQFTSVMIVQV